LYQFLRAAGARAPLVATGAVALHPLFLSHVGGLGDFAVSLSFVMLALRAAQLSRPSVAGALVGLAAGCRMPCVVFALPVAMLAEPGVGAWNRRARTLSWAGAISGLVYAPLFAAWGTDLLHNFPFRTLGYHVSAFAFRLLVSLGPGFWLFVGGMAAVQIYRRRLRGLVPSRMDRSAAGLVALGLLILFRVPTKPELCLPILLGATIFLSVRLARLGSLALLTCSVAAGLVLLSPYRRDSGEHRWHIEGGHYFNAIEQACDNRLMAKTMLAALQKLPDGAVLVANVRWTLPQARLVPIETVSDVDGVAGLMGFRFGDVPGNRLLVSFQEAKLKDLLERRQSAPGGGVYYDSRLEGMLRRWMGLEPSHYGRPLTVGGQSLRGLLSVAGLSNAEVVGRR
jgi:hypothetical protein